MAGKTTVYLKAEQCIEVKKPDVTVGDLMAVECTDPIMLSKIKTIKVLKINAKEQRRYVMSILRVIELIHRQYSEVDI